MHHERTTRKSTAVLILLAFACGGEPREPEPPQSARPRPPSRVERERAARPPPPVARPPAPAPRLTAVRPGCHTEQTYTFRGAMRAHGDIGIAARDDVGGLLVFRSDADAFAVAPISARGAPNGPMKYVHIAGALDVAAARIIGDEALIVLDTTCEGGLRPCRSAARFDLTGELIGPRIGRRVVDRQENAYRWRPLDITNETGDVLFLIRRFDTSHAGEGVDVQRIALLDDGTPQLDDVVEIRADTPEGTLMGALFYGTAQRVTALFGWRGEDPELERDLSRRFLSYDGTRVTEITGLGGVIRDVVVRDDHVHVLVRKESEVFVGIFDRAGAALGPASRIDPDVPLPAPFTERLLLRMQEDEPAFERDGAITFAPTDALGRRAGDPIDLARDGTAAVTFTGSLFLVAVHEAGADTTKVVRIACRTGG